MRTTVWLGVMLLSTNCGGNKEAKTNADEGRTTSSTTSAAVPEEPPSAPDPEDRSGRQGMLNCPSAVPGSVTTLGPAQHGVLVTVTAKEPAAIEDIQRRAKTVERSSKTQRTRGIKHTGTGEGGGSLGRCPVVMRGTSVSAESTVDGATITVRPFDPDELTELRQQTSRLLSAMPSADATAEPIGALVTAMRVTVDGPLTVRDAEAVMRAAVPAVRTCSSDRVEAELTIEAAGKVEHVVVTSAAGATVLDCLARVLGSIDFPGGTPAKLSIRIPAR